MPPTRFLIVQETAEGLFLIRHSLDGEYAGDTWHEDLANLKKQVQFEFECAIDWASFPYGVADPIEFVREKVDKSADRRGGAA